MGRSQVIKLYLPHQKPQIVDLREVAPRVYRLNIFDRFDRVETLHGEDIGLDIILFRSSRFPRITRLVMKKDFSQAIFRNFEGQEIEVDVHKL
jgi:hypothetical protein